MTESPGVIDWDDGPTEEQMDVLGTVDDPNPLGHPLYKPEWGIYNVDWKIQLVGMTESEAIALLDEVSHEDYLASLFLYQMDKIKEAWRTLSPRYTVEQIENEPPKKFRATGWGSGKREALIAAYKLVDKYAADTGRKNILKRRELAVTRQYSPQHQREMYRADVEVEASR